VDLVAGWLLASLVIDGSLGGVGPLVGSSLGSLVDIGSSFGATHVGLYCWRRVGRGGGCSVVVVVRVVVVAAVVVVAVFFLVATCRFKDTGWISLFEAGKMRENGP